MNKRIALVSGEPQTGKTRLCLQGLAWCRDNNLACSGIVCPGIYTANVRVGISCLNVADGTSKLLATSRQVPDTNQEAVHAASRLRENLLPPHLETPAYLFSAAAFASCEPWLISSEEAILWLDELGPLEFNRRAGFVKAFDLLRAGKFRAAVVVVRPSLVEQFIKEFAPAGHSIISSGKTSAWQELKTFLAEQV